MISKEIIEHIAKLARIELTEKEKERFSNELSAILDYVDKLNQIDTSEIKGISQVTGLENVVRKDEIRSTSRSDRDEIRNKILNEAPEKKDNYFKVPKILE